MNPVELDKFMNSESHNIKFPVNINDIDAIENLTNYINAVVDLIKERRDELKKI